MIGQKFHRWTVTGIGKKVGNKQFYKCRCECGIPREVRKDQLLRGVSKSCGCWKAEVAREQIVRLSTTHGHSRTRTHKIWKGMRKRCNNPNDKNYKSYGARGIRVCVRWDDFSKFLLDMGEVPDGHSIDRIDVNGNYDPVNCRWADKRQQMNNMRTNVLIQYRGETHTLKEWSRIIRLPYHRLYQRIFRLGWSINKSFASYASIEVAKPSF